MRYTLLLTTLLFSASLLHAQKRGGDFIESTSYNPSRMEMVRSLQYYPEDGGFACVNGSNRYTRALYGGYTEYRIETSDRPIFASFKKKLYRNLRFYVNGLRLDSAAYCKSVYKDGTRAYTIIDQAWGNRSLRLLVAMPTDSECALWQLSIDGEPVDLRIVTGEIANTKLNRNGDMGADKPGSFEPAADQPSRREFHFSVGKSTCLLLRGVDDFSLCDDTALMTKTLQANRTLASTISISTPDPYFNTLDGALAFAADGLWDGTTHTWLHGAIGWRTPLAGWRAAFVGDVMGWQKRQEEHFCAYANSQVVDVPPVYPHPTQDSTLHLARAEKKWGTQMYSNGYICRYPSRTDQMSHYDMNLNYVDELLRHFDYNPDTAFMRRLWPVIERTVDWENRNFDPDGNGLYDGYACIWASDGLYYGGGEATHSTAYNYKLNMKAAEVAKALGLDCADAYAQRARRIAAAADSLLWMTDKGHWAEYRDRMGLGRIHPDAALWSYYTPIDCSLGTPRQHFSAAGAMRSLPHIAVDWTTAHYDSLGISVPEPTSHDAAVCSTSDWMPYCWSINNVAPAEIMHGALACFKAGDNREGMRLMRGVVMDQMYLGHSPANFGQISYYDAARGECYRDFGDVVGIASRALVEGMLGIDPQGLEGRCIITPGFAGVWDSVSVATPYVNYTYTARPDGLCRLSVSQQFQSGNMQIVFRLPDGRGSFVSATGTADTTQVLTLRMPSLPPEPATKAESLPTDTIGLGLGTPRPHGRLKMVDMDEVWNASVTDIYNNVYLSPRPKTTSLEIPTQGVGEWCHPLYTPVICDSALRQLATDGTVSVAGVPFRSSSQGPNIAFTSLWDNYPDSISVALDGRASCAYLLMAGSTNHMQTHISNATITAHYADGTSDELQLIPPFNWCPIEQDYFVDGKAFSTVSPRPIRFCLATGQTSRDLGKLLGLSAVYGRELPGGAAQLLTMPLNKYKRLRSVTLRTLSNDVVIGLMGITLQR